MLVSSTNILAETVLRINIVLMSRCHLTGFILVDPSPQRIPRSFGISDTDGICAIHVEKLHSMGLSSATQRKHNPGFEAIYLYLSFSMRVD